MISAVGPLGAKANKYIAYLSAYAIPAATLAGTVYYVDASIGSDSYNATQAQNPATPWLTVKKAHDTVPIAGGCIIFIKNGTYALPGSTFSINRQFTTDVLFKAETTGGVIMTGTSFNVLRFGSGTVLTKGSNCTFQGIQFGAAGYTASSGVLQFDDTIAFPSLASNMHFIDCRLLGIGPLIRTRSDIAGTPTQGFYNWTFDRCYFEPSGASGVVISAQPTTPASATGGPNGLFMRNCSGYIANPATFSAAAWVNNWTITNPKFLGSGASVKAIQIGTEAAATGTTGERCRNVTIIGGSAKSIDSHAILIGGGVSGVTIEGVRVIGGDQGIVLKECSDVDVVSCRVSMPRSDIAINGCYHKAAVRCRFVNCDVDGYVAVAGGGLLAVGKNNTSGNLSKAVGFLGCRARLAKDAGANGVCLYWNGSTEDSSVLGDTSIFDSCTLIKGGSGVYGSFYGTTFTTLAALTAITYPCGTQGFQTVLA
jgi:hypothetical protein